ncbi:methyl-accepting chemotaxis protein [Halobacteriaceae archaeon GCM10025711]
MMGTYDQQTMVVMALVAAGALVMLVSAVRTRGIFKLVSRDAYRNRWVVLFGLMVLFLGGYVGTIGVIVNGYDTLFEWLTGGVFLAGALFVLLVVDTGRKTIEQVEALRAETEELNQHLEQKADSYRDVMQDCRDGDLTRRMDPASQNQAMTEIGEEFNAMMATVEATVNDLKLFADEVATYSREITMSTEEVKAESEQVAASMQDISAKADSQNQSLQEASDEMRALLTTIGEIAESSDEVAEISELTAETGREGREAAQEAIDGMREIEAEAADTVEQMEALEEQVEQIDDLTDFISEIAEQTNMLALNANIEANRGGEDGGGFAAVANEVKQLAAGTKQAAGDIEERLQDIQTETTQTVEEVRLTSDRIAEHTASVENAATALDQIAGYAQETNQGIQAIDRATDHQAESTEEVVDIVDDAVGISQATSSESASVAEAANAQTVALRQVTAGTDTLATQAQQLRSALERFEVDVAESDVASVADDDGSPPQPPEPDDTQLDISEPDDGDKPEQRDGPYPELGIEGPDDDEETETQPGSVEGQ